MMIIIIQRFSHLNKQFLVQSLNVSIGKLSCYFVLSEKNRKWERDLGQIFNNMDFSPFHIVRKLQWLPAALKQSDHFQKFSHLLNT